MKVQMKEVPATEREVHQICLDWLKRRGVSLNEIAELTFYLQKDLVPDITPEECLHHVKQVIEKREVQNALLTGIQMDVLAEREQLLEPLQDMVVRDECLYGIDEVLSLAILNVYGSIGLTNYGFIDRVKPGVLARLNNKNDGEIHTFLDDLVGAIAASAAARLAHNRKKQQEE
ncbi:phosphatidylglycerophosphatase A [Paenactinomyces guangxiensis]|uniref:Phosphatidylglycerophosphatase A n=1 Tax=Paenactinomyces guangxiensis TaxID=1490290 RepID=A0A7W1WPK3_9BACL|nr:phosphatidylglycerophosphatase A [Paenactinomyces guangxiensis]MBA4493716.1 phosphatidylglycerophosphatase A [Paenactinomyces guangxiensis]MBH8591003.1 phosphatidylglycerophosphatase A [Paenactinomyces guangxiensis]